MEEVSKFENQKRDFRFGACHTKKILRWNLRLDRLKSGRKSDGLTHFVWIDWLIHSFIRSTVDSFIHSFIRLPQSTRRLHVFETWYKKCRMDWFECRMMQKSWATFLRGWWMNDDDRKMHNHFSVCFQITQPSKRKRKRKRKHPRERV